MNNPVDDMNDTLSDEFYFKTWFCNGIGNNDDLAWEIGNELLSLYNGASMILEPTFEKLKIYSFSEDNRVCNFKNDYHDDLRLKDNDVNADIAVISEHNKYARVFPAFRLIDLSKREDDIWIILKYFSMELNWLTLYKLRETLKHYAKQYGFTLKAQPADIERFTAAANNFSISGIHSRHGPSKRAPPTRTMTLLEARQFIREMTQAYLSSRGFL